MYVPAAGHISPAIDRIPVGLRHQRRPRPGELVGPLTCRFRLCGGTSPCSTTHFGAACRVKAGRIRDRIGPGAPSTGVGALGWMYESSLLKGLTIRNILEELFRF